MNFSKVNLLLTLIAKMLQGVVSILDMTVTETLTLVMCLKSLSCCLTVCGGLETEDDSTTRSFEDQKFDYPMYTCIITLEVRAIERS